MSNTFRTEPCAIFTAALRNILWHEICCVKKHMLSSVSSASSFNVNALNTASLLAQVQEARKALLAARETPAANAVAPKNVRALYNDYVQFFLGNTDAKKVGLEEIENALKDQFNAVLSLVSSKKTYGFPLDIAKILDENPLPKDNVCKKGNEAYKFYVRKIVSELNNLHEILTHAKKNLSQLQTLIQTEDFENPSVHELLTRLRIAETDGEAIKKTFSEYMVPKNFNILYRDVYKYNGEEKTAPRASTAKSTASGSEAYAMPESTEINWDTNKGWIKNQSTFPSVIPNGISSVDDLRTKIITDKLTGSRIVTAYYFQKGIAELTDRYDTNADVRYQAQDQDISAEPTPLSFFGELTLLDKLKYIVLYYTKGDDRRIFPDDKNIGFPCLPNVAPTGINPVTGEDRKYTDDINEIAHLEPFYIGFLVDRDGPVNALASFMEIKSAAIGEQIRVLGYRVKALRYYLRLINRGLEEVNKSQSNGNARIPNAAYEILTMVGSNPTRCLKTINGKDYFVLQWNGNEGHVTVHTSPNGCYLLVPADDDGMKAFIEYGNKFDYCYDHLFDETQGIMTFKDQLVPLGFMSQSEYDHKNRTETTDYGPLYKDKKWEYELRNIRIRYEQETEIESSVFKLCQRADWEQFERYSEEDNWSIWRVKRDWHKISEEQNTQPFPPDCPLLLLKENDESKLPRELETGRMNIKKLLDENYHGITWNNYEDNDYAKTVWSSIVTNWKTTYDTVIGNFQAQLESVNKSIESLRNKINTFDTSAMNFRNKAYIIYNKTVNNIE